MFADKRLPQDFFGSSLALFLFQQKQDNATAPALNLAHHFQPDFHAAFAATAFTSLLLALTVFGVSVAMWHVDPGRDSIIYRMTSQRIKKDQ